MKTISNWSMKRAGAGITITGLDAATGLVTKLVGIKQVELAKNAAGVGKIIVATGDDAEYQLVVY